MLVRLPAYGRTGNLVFAQYSNGQTAIKLVEPSGETLALATVNLEGLSAPPPGPDQVWIKDWSENEGMLEALIQAGVVKPTGTSFNPNWDAWAFLADLTPAALAEKESQMAEEE